MRSLIIALSFIVLPTTTIAQECPADFKRPSYKTRAAFCVAGQTVADYYDFDKKIKCEDMEVDHLISLKLAHCSGLTGDKLREFANDARNLKFTFWLTNRKKGAKDLSEFSAPLPPEMRERVLIDGIEIMADYNIPIDPQLSKSLLSVVKSKNAKLKELGDRWPPKTLNLDGKLITPKRAIRKTSAAIVQRTGKFAVREIAILPLEQIPFAGLAFALAFLAWDLKDTCDTTTDLKNLEEALFPEDEDIIAQADIVEVCGLEIPDPQEIISKMRDPEYLSEVYDNLREQIKERSINIELPPLPDFPDWPDMPDMPDWPDWPDMPDMPDWPISNPFK